LLRRRAPFSCARAPVPAPPAATPAAMASETAPVIRLIRSSMPCPFRVPRPTRIVGGGRPAPTVETRHPAPPCLPPSLPSFLPPSRTLSTPLDASVLDRWSLGVMPVPCYLSDLLCRAQLRLRFGLHTDSSALPYRAWRNTSMTGIRFSFFVIPLGILMSLPTSAQAQG
jgi:hypothetical protein